MGPGAIIWIAASSCPGMAVGVYVGAGVNVRVGSGVMVGVSVGIDATYVAVTASPAVCAMDSAVRATTVGRYSGG